MRVSRKKARRRSGDFGGAGEFRSAERWVAHRQPIPRLHSSRRLTVCPHGSGLGRLRRYRGGGVGSVGRRLRGHAPGRRERSVLVSEIDDEPGAERVERENASDRAVAPPLIGAVAWVTLPRRTTDRATAIEPLLKPSDIEAAAAISCFSLRGG